MGSFVDGLKPGINTTSDVSVYEEAYWRSGYKMPIAWVIKKFYDTPDAVEYYNQVRNAEKDVILISKDEYESAKKAVELVLVSPYAASYFVKGPIHEELLHQVAIYFTYKGQEFKALLDGIKINHRDKTIEPFDLKSTGKYVYQFKESYLLYGYYRQGALYEQALYSPESPVKDLLEQGYTMLDFKFIVTETKMSSTNPAIIFRTTPNERNAGLNGGYAEGKYYPGINELLDNYLWHLENDHWIYPKDVYLNDGVMDLNIFNI